MTALSDTLLTQAAETFGTPLYLYNLDKVVAQVAALRDVLPDATLLYAVKANPNGAVLKTLAALSLGAEVITLGELARAVRAGIPPKRILLGGPRQDADLIRQAVMLGVGRVSLDSVSQWRVWREVDAPSMRFLPRVNPGLDPRTHEHLATGAATSKFGMTPPEAAEVAEEVAAQGRLAGFHVHAGSQISELDVYDEIFSVLGPLYDRFEESEELDIGGGFVVPGFGLVGFAEKVAGFAERHSLKVTVEPGRFLVAEAGVLLSRVLHVKGGALNHVIADAGMADLLRPALYGAAHPIRAVGKTGTGFTADVDGPLCENADRLGQTRHLPEVVPGDLLVVEQAGAYGFAMASNYASSLRPAEAVLQSGNLRLVRKRETVEDLLRLELD
ncbi:diaminopimelate decarboxylase [soil metagenome]